MAGVNLNDWAKSVQERLDDKVSHVHTVVEQKLDYQQKFIEQRLDNVASGHAEKFLTFSVRLEEAMAEIRGYKDILQQQLTLIDSTVKKAHARIDDYEKSEALADKDRVSSAAEMLKRLEGHEALLQSLQADVSKILQDELVETVQKEARQNDPVRKFLGENGQKVLLFILGGLGLYLLRNLGSIAAFFNSLGGP